MTVQSYENGPGGVTAQIVNESSRSFYPPLLYLGINVDLRPQDHYAIQHVIVVGVEADGRLTPLLSEPAVVE